MKLAGQNLITSNINSNSKQEQIITQKDAVSKNAGGNVNLEDREMNGVKKGLIGEKEKKMP